MHFTRDPDSVLDFAFDWSTESWLDEDEVITSFSITAGPGLTIDFTEQQGGIIVAWVSGGEAGSSSRVTCRITTSAGRTDERTMTIVSVER